MRAESGEQVGAPEPSGELLTALRTMDADEVAAVLHNDLQQAAISLEPILAEVLEAGLDLGARGGVVSGSGPTVAFLVASQAEAIDLSVGLAANGPAGDIVRAIGPVPGTQIIQHRSPGSAGPTGPAPPPRPGPLGPSTG